MAPSNHAHAATYAYVSNAESQSISVLALDLQTGLAALRQTVTLTGTVMPLAVSPDRRFLYAALRSQPYAVASFHIDGKTGLLSLIGCTALPESMSNIATDRTGRLLFAASYGGSLLSVSRIDAAGRVAPAHQIMPTKPMAHALQPSPDNRFALACCLGGDVLLQLRLEAEQGRLKACVPGELALPAKSGPRHLRFHPNGRYVYVVGELDANVHVFAYDTAHGQLTLLQTARILPPDFAGLPAAAELHLTPDGRFLYASERSSHTLAAFRIEADGACLQKIGSFPTETQPRGFAIDPSGRYLLAVGQKSHAASLYRIGPTGGLTQTAALPLGKGPNWVEIIELPSAESGPARL